MRASAPGKLFIFGEYTVLEGGTALIYPAPLEAKTESVASEDSIVVTHSEQKVTLDLSEALRQLPLVSAIAELVGVNCFKNKMTILDTRPFFKGKQKLGLGSSSALTVSTIKCLRPELSMKDTIELGTRCHNFFQKKKGSGGDVALAAHGQPILFNQAGDPRPVAQLQGLHILAIWTGKPASTSNFLIKLEEWKSESGEIFYSKMEELSKISLSCAHNVEEQNTSNLIENIIKFDSALEAFSNTSQLNFYSDNHLRMKTESKKAGLAYKPSGAGGGDFGISFSDDAQRIKEFSERLSSLNIFNFIL